MAIAGIASSVPAASAAVDTESEYGTRLARKVLDMASVEGAQYARMIESAAGLGRNLNTQA